MTERWRVRDYDKVRRPPKVSHGSEIDPVTNLLRPAGYFWWFEDIKREVAIGDIVSFDHNGERILGMAIGDEFNTLNVLTLPPSAPVSKLAVARPQNLVIEGTPVHYRT